MRSVRLPQTLRRTKRPTSTTDMKVKRYLLWCPSRAVKKKKKSSFHQKLSVVFCLFLLVPRSSLEKKKLTVPLSVPSPLVVLRRAQLTDFYMFPLGTMCEKREGKGSYRWGRMCEMLQCDIGGFSPSSVQVVFPPLPRRVPANPPSCVLGVDGGLCGRTEDGVGPAGERTERRRQRGRSEGITEREGRR